MSIEEKLQGAPETLALYKGYGEPFFDWIEYAAEMERQRDEALSFVKDMLEIWDDDGDSGFPAYKKGKALLEKNAEHKSKHYKYWKRITDE